MAARGHVRQRGNSWEVRVRAGTDPTTGRPRVITRTAPTRKQAETLRTRLLGELDDGAHTGPDGTMATLLEQWITAKTPKWSPKNTLETRGYVERWIAPPEGHPRHGWALGHRRVSDLTPQTLNAFNDRLAQELAPSTVRRIHGVVRAALEQAVRWDWIVRNPAARTEEIEGQSAEVQPPAREDVRLLLRATLATPPLHLFIRLAVITGRRRGELCALRWSDFNWEAMSVVVSRTLVDGGPGRWVERPISKNTKRFPPMAVDPVTVGLLHDHWVRTAALLDEIGLPLPEDSHLFVTLGPDGLAPWTPDAVSTRFRRACVAAGVDFHPHQLRHLAVTTMLDGGIALPTTAGRVGHGGGGKVTAEVYAHFLPATDQRSAAMLAALID